MNDSSSILKQGVTLAPHLNALQNTAFAQDADSHHEVTNEYGYGEVFQGYSATLRGAALDQVLESYDVAHVEHDSIMTILPHNESNPPAEIGGGSAVTEGGEGVDIYSIGAFFFVRGNVLLGSELTY